MYKETTFFVVSKMNNHSQHVCKNLLNLLQKYLPIYFLLAFFYLCSMINLPGNYRLYSDSQDHDLCCYSWYSSTL